MRALFPNSSLADLYDPVATPAELMKAHKLLDKAVDVAYGRREFQKEADRVAFLFVLYQKITSPLELEKHVGKSKRSGRAK